MYKLYIIILIIISYGYGYCNEPIYSNSYSESIKLAESIDHNILLIFGADWCVNCEVLKKDLQSNSDFKNIIICDINIEKSPDIAKLFNIKKIPVSIILDKNKKIISRYTGYDEYSKYISWYKERVP
jgi:thioredoxin-related protein